MYVLYRVLLGYLTKESSMKKTIGLNRKELKTVSCNKEYKIRAFKMDWNDPEWYYFYEMGNHDRTSWKYYRKTQYYRKT